MAVARSGVAVGGAGVAAVETSVAVAGMVVGADTDVSQATNNIRSNVMPATWLNGCLIAILL